MEFSKAFNIEVNYKDRRSGINWESLLFAEVVFIDQTHPSAAPILYQLKDNILSIQTANPFKTVSISRESFTPLGEIVLIDKKKKQILLINKNTVSYQHLIIASGSKQLWAFQNEEFTVGLHMLIDAIKVKPKIPDSFATHAKHPLGKASKPFRSQANRDISHQAHSMCIDKIVHPYISSVEGKKRAPELSVFNKRLYQVQL
jgi:hypothetical protein